MCIGVNALKRDKRLGGKIADGYKNVDVANKTAEGENAAEYKATGKNAERGKVKDRNAEGENAAENKATGKNAERCKADKNAVGNKSGKKGRGKKVLGGRNGYGIVSSAVGIALNAVLCAAKIAAGVLSGSVAVLADGMNNVTDAGSGAVSLLGFRWAGKPADREHPFGHARYEYITGLIIALIVLVLGVETGVGSVEKIIGGEGSEWSLLTPIVLGASIVVKTGMFFFYRYCAGKIGSGALKAAATDSLCDCVSTAAVLICAVVARFTGAKLDGYVGLAVAIFIVFNGVKLVKQTMSPLLGEKPSAELVRGILEKARSYEGVIGVHDLIVHNYGPSRYFASIHIEVSADRDILSSHELVDGMERDFLAEGINLVAHIDPVVADERADELKETVRGELWGIAESLKIHDFRAVFGEKSKKLIFDVVMPYDFPMTEAELGAEIEKRMSLRIDGISLVVNCERDLTGE